MIDPSSMHTMHDTLREKLSRVDVRTVIADAPAWQAFKVALHVHHSTEDDILFPVLRHNLAATPDALALLEAMEAEHDAIKPLITTLDAAALDPSTESTCLHELLDALTTGLLGHLKHEEDAALPLIARSLSTDQWTAFEQLHEWRLRRAC